MGLITVTLNGQSITYVDRAGKSQDAIDRWQATEFFGYPTHLLEHLMP